MERPLRGAVLVLILVLAPAGVARAAGAGDAAVAEALYNEAKKLYAAGDLAAACPKFAESVRLDPAPGSRNALARCYERTGKPASAWALYREVVTEAGQKGETKRAEDAQKAAAALEPTLPRLVVTVAPETASLPGLTIERDGAPLGPPQWSTPLPVDLGEHVIRAVAPGRRPWEGRVQVEKLAAGAAITVPPLDPAPASPPPAPSGLGAPRVAAVTLGAVGVAGLAVGGIFGGLAASQWSDARSSARTGCADPIHFTGCSAAAVSVQQKASTFATVSTAGLAAGGALAGAAILLWVLGPGPAKPPEKAWLAPSIAPGSAGLHAGGWF